MLTQGASMEGPEGKQIQSVEQMIGRFTGELITHIKQWETDLIDAPGDLETIERQYCGHAPASSWCGQSRQRVLRCRWCSVDLGMSRWLWRRWLS